MNVFISYAHADRDWVRELSSSLRDAGLHPIGNVEDVAAGEHWLETLRHDIESAELIVSVMTEESLQSPIFLFELGAARAARRQVLPLLITKNGKPTEAPQRITGSVFLRVESPSEAAEQIREHVSKQLAVV